MNTIENKIVSRFKALIGERLHVRDMILFGSRARGDADVFSDMDILLVIDEEPDDEMYDFISDCAWEAGFYDGVVVMPVVFSRYDLENGPGRYSLLIKAAKLEGIRV